MLNARGYDGKGTRSYGCFSFASVGKESIIVADGVLITSQCGAIDAAPKRIGLKLARGREFDAG